MKVICLSACKVQLCQMPLITCSFSYLTPHPLWVTSALVDLDLVIGHRIQDHGICFLEQSPRGQMVKLEVCVGEANSLV